MKTQAKLSDWKDVFNQKKSELEQLKSQKSQVLYKSQDFENSKELFTLLRTKQEEFNKISPENNPSNNIAKLKLIIQGIEIIKDFQSRGKFNQKLYRIFSDEIQSTVGYQFHSFYNVLSNVCGNQWPQCYNHHFGDLFLASISRTDYGVTYLLSYDNDDPEKLKGGRIYQLRDLLVNILIAWDKAQVDPTFQDAALPLILEILIERINQAYIEKMKLASPKNLENYTHLPENSNPKKLDVSEALRIMKTITVIEGDKRRLECLDKVYLKLEQYAKKESELKESELKASQKTVNLNLVALARQKAYLKEQQVKQIMKGKQDYNDPKFKEQKRIEFLQLEEENKPKNKQSKKNENQLPQVRHSAKIYADGKIQSLDALFGEKNIKFAQFKKPSKKAILQTQKNQQQSQLSKVFTQSDQGFLERFAFNVNLQELEKFYKEKYRQRIASLKKWDDKTKTWVRKEQNKLKLPNINTKRRKQPIDLKPYSSCELDKSISLYDTSLPSF